jgi:hypothetical protein
LTQAPKQPAAKPSSSFLPFLPGDNGALGDPSSQEVIDIINEDLARLLRQKPADFWHTVRSDRSLKECLDSYLRYCRWAGRGAAPAARLRCCCCTGCHLARSSSLL